MKRLQQRNALHILKCFMIFYTGRLMLLSILLSHLCVDETLIKKISDTYSSVDHVKYADDITLYHPAKKGDCKVHDSTAHHANISCSVVNHLQQALDYTSNYCKENLLIINVQKSTALNFNLRNLSVYRHSVKLTVTHLINQKWNYWVWFSTNTINLTPTLMQYRKDTLATVKLKRSGVNPSALALFYRARILSVVSDSAPRIG